jgi:hypothetical protein
MMVWQAKERNEWGVAIDQVLAAHDGMAAVDRGAPDPFSLADPTTATALLKAAGFVDVTFTDVQQPVYYGPDTDTALAWVRGFTSHAGLEATGSSCRLARTQPAARDAGGAPECRRRLVRLQRLDRHRSPPRQRSVVNSEAGQSGPPNRVDQLVPRSADSHRCGLM